MRILGLDPSKRSMGWALWAPGDQPASGVWELGSELTSRGTVFARVHERMMELHQLGKIEAVFYEEALNIMPARPDANGGGGGSIVRTNKESILLSTGIAAHIESFGEAMGFRIIRPVNQTSWRRHFLGPMKRGTKKVDLKAYAMERCRQLGFRPSKHDQAEAIGVLDYACASLNIIPPWSASEVLRPALRDCQDFRVWPGIMGNKESHYVTTQRTCHTE